MGAGLILARVPLSHERIAAICILVSGFLFAGQGGTHIVRGILDKVGTVPRSRESASTASGEEGKLDTAEYNRGRVIGNLERWLLLVTIILGSYAALGFLLAAKGLIRIKELENRDFAEYFLIGTLSSVAVALVLGLLVQWAIVALW